MSEEILLKEFVEKVKAKEIKAIWMIKHEKEYLMILLVDDFKAKGKKIKEIKVKALKLANKILKEHNIVLHPEIVFVSDFYNKIIQNKIDIFLEIKKAVCLYDTGFFMPIKALLNKGEIKGTKEALFKLVLEVRKNMKEIKEIKLDVLSALYSAVIDAAESALMTKGIGFFIPREIPKLLEKEFFRKKLISKKTLRAFQAIYDTYKAYEHGKISEINGKELDRLIKKADSFITEMQDLASEAMEEVRKSTFQKK